MPLAQPAPNAAEAWNAKCDGYRDQLLTALAEAGRTLRPDELKQAQAAGGFLAEKGGDADAALGSAINAGHRAVSVLAAYTVVLAAQARRAA